ncbi:DUF6531 domain-containing protein [Aquabacterium sp. A7-Y]|uniref:RHS repeat-associated core domain-containing protein n=1 Tax=Aquabacterium sp. A7-Y TaxID=1349605 RepID=UPI00223E6D6E|nr:RHS repeat-associated core domain-containing protein [Aquabacterium sp. A7-Y]MCW7540925.1 DUF6531 domain-containing protein [Aquabacterium sp. A7-Y]
MFEAARLGDPISHSSALAGFLVGAVIGIALIAAVAFATFTCGFGAALLAGLVAGVAATGILSLGEAIGAMFRSTTGKITRGSEDVFINSRNAAHVQRSTVVCSKHSPLPLVAEGSTNVFINSLPAARKGDSTTCGGKVEAGSRDVFIGGGQQRYLEVADEVPKWLRTTVDWAFALAGLVGGLAGLARKAGSTCLRAFAPCAAKFTAGFVAGELFGRYVAAPAIGRAWGALVGNPVDVVTGRKLLLGHEEVDFELIDRLPISVSRFYASDLTHEGMLGRGWVTPWEVTLRAEGELILYTDAQGRDVPFQKVEPGQQTYSEAEQKYLACSADGRYFVYDLTETYYQFASLPEQGRAPLLRIEDQLGQHIGFERDEAGRLLAVASSTGQRVALHYEHPLGRLTSVERVAGGPAVTLVRYGYDEQGQLNSVTDRAGHEVRRFEYQGGLMVRHVNALGFACSYRWETIAGQPRVVEHETSEGERYRFRYDPANRESWAEDHLGRKAHWRYDEHRQITECTDFDGSQYRTEYNEAGQPTKVHLPGGRTLGFRYDELGRVIEAIDPLDRGTTYHYHRNSLRRSLVVLPDGSQWKAEFDILGLLQASTDPLGRSERYEYQDNGLPHTHIDARGGQQKMAWNERGQLLAYTDCSGKTTRYEYDDEGRLHSAVNALGETTRVEHGERGEVVAIHHPDGHSERFEYDAAGLLRQHLDAAEHRTAWQRNARGQVTLYTDAAQRSLSYRYDALGRLCQLTNGNGASYHFEYDTADRLSKQVSVDGIETHYRYTAAGEVCEVLTVGRDAEGRPQHRELHYQHDAVGRVLQAISTTAVTRYAYDEGDRLIEVRRDPTTAGVQLGIAPDTIRFEYDAAGQLLAEHGANGSVRYELDELGNPLQIQLPQGQHIDLLRYGSGHVHQIRMGEQVISDFERDDLHREVLRTQGRLTSRFGYDPRGRLLWQKADAPPAPLGGPVHRRQAVPAPQSATLWRNYRYDAAGELVEQQDPLRGSTRYRYDPSGRLLNRRSDIGAEQSFAWDAAGNLLEANAAKSAGLVQDNRLRVWQDLRFDYDAFGNLSHKRKSTWREQRFEYDGEDRLIAIHQRNHDRRSVVRFGYDALGRRTAKEELRDDGTGLPGHCADRTTFVWQGLRLLQEIKPTSVRSYVYEENGGSGYAPVARVDQLLDARGGVGADVGRVYYFHADPIGTPQELTDAAGELVWAGRYQAWGKIDEQLLRDGLERTDQQLRYAGQYEDSESGLHYNTFRYYDPDTGRFLSQDPIGIVGGSNLYAYAPNPSRWGDPMGWCPQVLFGQRRIAGSFRQNSGAPSYIEGRTLADVASDLKSGVLHPDQLPVSYFVHPKTGQWIAESNRTLAALAEAGMKPTVLREVPVTQELLNRLAEKSLRHRGQVLSMPGTSIPVTVGPNNLEIVRIISLP